MEYRRNLRGKNFLIFKKAPDPQSFPTTVSNQRNSSYTMEHKDTPTNHTVQMKTAVCQHLLLPTRILFWKQPLWKKVATSYKIKHTLPRNYTLKKFN